MPLYKRTRQPLPHRIENGVLGTELTDLHTGYRGVQPRTPAHGPFLRNSLDFSFDSELLMQASHFGFRIGEVPARTRYSRRPPRSGFGASTIYGVKTLWAAARLLLHRAHRPALAEVLAVIATPTPSAAPVTGGERVTTPAGGFNPTWQRHVAAYEASTPLLPEGRILDLGCGVGHSYHLLAPRETVGVDIDPEALAGQERETHVADMRRAALRRTMTSTECFQSSP